MDDFDGFEDGADGAPPKDPRQAAADQARRQASQEARRQGGASANDSGGGDVAADAAECFVTEALSGSNARCCLAEASFDLPSADGCCAAEASFGGADCFVATATMGAQHPDLDSLRAFRDRVLQRSAPGRLFTRWYYTYGAYIARFISNKPRLKFVVREGVVRPLARLARKITGV